MKGKLDVLGDLIWVQYPKCEHAAREILNHPAADPGMIWVRWVVNGRDEQIPKTWVRELTGRRRSQDSSKRPSPRKRILQALVATKKKEKKKKLREVPPKQQQQPRKDPQPQHWPHAPFSEAQVQSRDIELGDYVYRDEELFRVAGIACLFHKYEHSFGDVLRLVHVDTGEVVYEDKECVEPGMTE